MTSQTSTAARDYARADERPRYRVLVFREGYGKVKRLDFTEPADALAGALDYLKSGYQVRLGDELVAHYRDQPGAPAWWPSLRDWRLLAGMLRRAIESPGFFNVSAESAGRAEAERLAERIAAMLATIAAAAT